MAEYLDNAAGITTSTGVSTSGLVVSNSIDQYGPIIGAATDGVTYPYYIKYVDVADGADYETGQGTWDSGTNTLTSTSVSTSSNSGNAVNWGPGQKAIFITADASLSTDMEQMVNGSTKFYLTSTQAANIAASKTKTDLITVTQAVNLDQMEADIAAFASGMTYKGNWDASVGTFPGGGTANIGDFYYVNVTGTVDAVEFTVGDNIVALTNNASISTFSGNWSKHDQTDAVQSVAGLVGTITADQLITAIPINQPFNYKPAGEPILILAFGDSNMVGVGGSDPTIQTADTDCYFWATPGVSPYNTANLDWRNVDPNAAVVTDFPSAPTPYFGLFRGSNGSTAFGLATRLRQMTGRDVYVVCAAQGGVTNAYWQPGGGAGKEGMTELLTQIPLALADMPVTPDFFDVVYMSGGGNDCGSGVSDATFISTWQTMYDEMVAQGWVDPARTQWFQGELPQVYAAYAAGWTGLQALQNATPSNVQVVSSIGLLTAMPDLAHFTPYSLDQMGAIAATASVSNQYHNAVERNFFRSESTIADGASAVAHRLDTSTAYSTAGAKYLQISTDGTEKFSFGVGNIIRGDQTNNTPLLFRMSGNSGYDLSYIADTTGASEFTSLNTGGPKGAWLGSRMSAGAGFPAFRFFASNSLTGSSSVVEFGHLGLVNAASISRNGLITAADGFVATAGGLVAAVGTVSSLQTTAAKGTQTVTAQLAPAFNSTGIITHNWASNNVGYRVHLNETHVFQQSTGAVTGLFVAQNTFKNDPGFTGSFSYGKGLWSNNTFTADTTSSNCLIVSDIHSQPSFGVVNGGTYTTVLYTHYLATGTVETGATISTRYGYQVADFTVTGTVTSQAGFNVTLSNATNNTMVLLGSATVPTGNFGIYQDDAQKYVNRWSAGHRLAYRASNATSITMTVADHVLKVTTTSGPATVNLPTAVGNSGLNLIIKRTGTQTVTVDGNGAETIDGTATKDLTLADQLLSIVSDGANWLMLHNGAP